MARDLPMQPAALNYAIATRSTRSSSTRRARLTYLGPVGRVTEKYSSTAVGGGSTRMSTTSRPQAQSASLTERASRRGALDRHQDIYDLENVIEAHQINQALNQDAVHRDADTWSRMASDHRRRVHRPHSPDAAGPTPAPGCGSEEVSGSSRSRSDRDDHGSELFPQYEKLAGMTGTALTESEEFHKILRVDVVAPTNKRGRSTARSSTNGQSKFEAVIDEIVDMNSKRPVLVGTFRREVRAACAVLEKRASSTTCSTRTALNARRPSLRGRSAQCRDDRTNMAGRARTSCSPGVTDVGPAHIGRAPRSRRIDNQLRGRAGRRTSSSRFSSL